MTRADDRMVGLLDRVQIASQSQGELFVSLHADSLVTAPQVSGASVYTLSERTSSDFASKESGAKILAGIDPSNQDDLAWKCCSIWPSVTPATDRSGSRSCWWRS